MLLSIIIPVYNERTTLETVLARVASALPGVDKEIIVVDDCSTDGTREWLREKFPASPAEVSALVFDGMGRIAPAPRNDHPAVAIRVHYHDRNRGKGGGIATGLSLVTGDVIIIQDADLEYDPEDWVVMYNLIAIRKVADFVYGSRFYGRPHRSLYFHHYLGNRIISMLFSMLYDQTLTDIETCYKMFSREVKDCLAITCNDFGFEVQISAQVARARRWRIYEMGIHFYARTYAEGKKIDWRDGLKALWYVVWFRVSRHGAPRFAAATQKVI